MSKMSYGKAIAFDGLEDHMFNIEGRCKKKPEEMCARCRHKMKLISNIFDANYWNSDRAALHFKARLIPLNKKFPNTPKVAEYRPIVVMSPLIKALELRVHRKLDEYQTRRLSQW